MIFFSSSDTFSSSDNLCSRVSFESFLKNKPEDLNPEDFFRTSFVYLNLKNNKRFVENNFVEPVYGNVEDITERQ